MCVTHVKDPACLVWRVGTGEISLRRYLLSWDQFQAGKTRWKCRKCRIPWKRFHDLKDLKKIKHSKWIFLPLPPYHLSLYFVIRFALFFSLLLPFSLLTLTFLKSQLIFYRTGTSVSFNPENKILYQWPTDAKH